MISYLVVALRLGGGQLSVLWHDVCDEVWRLMYVLRYLLLQLLLLLQRASQAGRQDTSQAGLKITVSSNMQCVQSCGECLNVGQTGHSGLWWSCAWLMLPQQSAWCWILHQSRLEMGYTTTHGQGFGPTQNNHWHMIKQSWPSKMQL